MTINRRDNFKEADKILAELWDVTKKDIVAFREDYKYTWHELNDMETMQLVPIVINDKCGHLDGVGEINIGNIFK